MSKNPHLPDTPAPPPREHAGTVGSPDMETPIVIKNLDTGNIHMVDEDGDVCARPPDSVGKRLWTRFYGGEEHKHEKDGGASKMLDDDAKSPGCWCF
mmetsp:Transcript_5946/g.11260  ORF Transcript_5946/g.11260 Transcript_5946/m.11260 type:complete len:97 (+) Transcript_5946:131-421(+)